MSIYIILISIAASIVTCYDKFAAKQKGAMRIPERILIFLSAIGGSIAMYITMLIIRHKTRHALFMVGIPIIFIIQLLLYIAIK